MFILVPEDILHLSHKFGLIDLVCHSHQRRRFRNLKTWSQVRQGTVFQSRCDYILGRDQRHFDLVGIRDMWNFSLEHFTLTEQFLRCPSHFHVWYPRRRRALPLMLSPTKKRSRADDKFQNLKAMEPVPPKLKRLPCPLWMSPASIRLIEKRADLRRNPCHSQNVARGITRAIRRSLTTDYQRLAEEAATEIGTCLDPATGGVDPGGAYNILKRWYCNASARSPNPYRTDMEKVRGDFQTLYQREKPRPHGLCLDTQVDPAKVNDKIPLEAEAEVEAAVQFLRPHRVGTHTHL